MSYRPYFLGSVKASAESQVVWSCTIGGEVLWRTARVRAWARRALQDTSDWTMALVDKGWNPWPLQGYEQREGALWAFPWQSRLDVGHDAWSALPADLRELIFLAASEVATLSGNEMLERFWFCWPVLRDLDCRRVSESDVLSPPPSVVDLLALRSYLDSFHPSRHGNKGFAVRRYGVEF